MNKLKTIDGMEGSSFQANGKTYHIASSMSAGRYSIFEKIESELGFGRSFIEIISELARAMDDFNKQKPGEMYVRIHNLHRGLAYIDAKKPHVYRYCALFINTEEEDWTTLTEDMINVKVKDWEAECIDFNCFFTFALNSLPGFRELYKKLTQTTSAEKR